MYKLRRTRDGAGDTGKLSVSLKYDENKQLVEGPSRPTVGYALRVGAWRATTFGNDTYWTTTYVTEILEDTPDYVRFKTGNSEYEWWQ